MRDSVVPKHIAKEIAEFRYRERFGLSSSQLQDEPADEIDKAFLIWHLDAEKEKMMGKRNN